MSLGEQIAVLDGLDALDPTDGRLGQRRAAVTQYAKPVMPGVLARRGVIDASGGANYSGGSSYAQGLPLMPSSVGLAGLDASDLIQGGYGRAGLGAAMIEGGYGRAGLGMTASHVDEDLAGAAEAMEVGRNAANSNGVNDGRIGQVRGRVDEYGRQVAPGVLERSNVLDASEGANYSGGSAYAPGLPLMPSSVGLAGFGNIPGVLPTRNFVIDASGGANYSGGSSYAPGLPLMPSSAGLAGLDAAPDKAIGIDRRVLGAKVAARVKKVAGTSKVRALKKEAVMIMRAIPRTRSAATQAKMKQRLAVIGQQLQAAREIRARLIKARGGQYAQRLPLWAR
jgi:hypothetical protein